MRDVTLEAFLESSNTEVAEVDKQGLVTAVRRGEAPMLARYEGRLRRHHVDVMGDRSGYRLDRIRRPTTTSTRWSTTSSSRSSRCPANCAPTPSSSAASIST